MTDDKDRPDKDRPDKDRPDKDHPDNVIPFPNVIPYALSRELRRYFQSLADEPLPAEIESLAQEFVKLAEGPAKAERPAKKPRKTKDTKEKV